MGTSRTAVSAGGQAQTRCSVPGARRPPAAGTSTPERCRPGCRGRGLESERPGLLGASMALPQARGRRRRWRKRLTVP